MSDIYQMYNNNTLLNNNIIFLSYLFILIGLPPFLGGGQYPRFIL